MEQELGTARRLHAIFGSNPNKTAGAPHRCEPGLGRTLHAGTLYWMLVDIQASVLRDVHSFGRLAGAGKVSTRRDLSGSVGAAFSTNVRFIADRLLLPYGIRTALYLDADTCVRASLQPLFDAASQPPEVALVVAHVPSSRLKVSTWSASNGFVSAEQRALIRTRWGFNSSVDQFYNGVFVLNLVPWCKRRLFARMCQVASFHATQTPLFRRVGGFNQAFMEVAAAGHTRFIGKEYNCRSKTLPFSKLPCVIDHYKGLAADFRGEYRARCNETRI